MVLTTIFLYIAPMRSCFILTLIILLSGCELGTDPATRVSPNYNLLGACEPSDNAYVAAVVAESLCGTIAVFENRETQRGRKVELNVMVLPAVSSVVKPDPIFLLAGGPGQSAVDVGPFLFSRLRVLRQERDVVLVDQRGTGESNSLKCDLDESEFDLLGLSIDEAMDMQVDALRACLADYDADPTLYTTSIAMDDLNEVREILGYRDINLIGISYGTRAGQVYLRRHEDSVRTLTIDAVVPMDVAIPENVALDAQAAFDALVADCTNQPACNAAFPELREQFNAVVDKLKQPDQQLAISHPRTGEVATTSMAPQLISRLIRSILYDRNLSRLVPLAITEANKGNFQILTTIAYAFTGDSMNMSTGMMMSVLCAEDMIRRPAEKVTPEFDNPMLEVLDRVCPFWPTGTIPEDFDIPVTSDKPVLVTSGVLDPITPPRYGEMVAQHLSNAEHIIVAGVGHGTLTSGCMPDILADFIETADPKALDTTCSTNLSRPPFFTSFAGPVLELNEQEANP